MSDHLSKHYQKARREWKRLESLTKEIRKNPRQLAAIELDDFDRLYRRTVVHLSQIRTRTRDQRLVAYLNDLVASAHSIIYLGDRKHYGRAFLNFWVTGFPQLIARYGRFHVAAFLIFSLASVFGYIAVEQDPTHAYAFFPEQETRIPGASYNELRTLLEYGRDEGGGTKFTFASFLFQNNFRVSINAMVVGILGGVFTAFIMTLNGMILGGMTHVYVEVGLGTEWFAWILPHGVTEIGAIILSGGIGLALGWATLAPGKISRAERIRQVGSDVVRMAGGVFVMLAAAALIESYLRQSHLSTEARYLFTAGTVVFWCYYFGTAAVKERRRRMLLEYRSQQRLELFS